MRYNRSRGYLNTFFRRGASFVRCLSSYISWLDRRRNCDTNLSFLTNLGCSPTISCPCTVAFVGKGNIWVSRNLKLNGGNFTCWRSYNNCSCSFLRSFKSWLLRSSWNHTRKLRMYRRTWKSDVRAVVVVGNTNFWCSWSGSCYCYGIASVLSFNNFSYCCASILVGKNELIFSTSDRISVFILKRNGNGVGASSISWNLTFCYLNCGSIVSFLDVRNAYLRRIFACNNRRLS